MWASARACATRAASQRRRVTTSSSSSSRAPVPRFALRSSVWAPTEKEVPADAAIPSHQLLVRGGFVRKSGHGSFAFLPLGRRVVAKLEALIDAEMREIRGNKLDLPLLIPAELWQQSGRWQTRGPELMTFADRRDAMHALAPTHEESVTSLVANHFQPGGVGGSLRLYQIGKKFRDEIRPRFGLLRAREFVMKDMYSFDTSFAAALETYDDVVRAYETILKARLRLPIAKVEADSGNIGGNLSHEFHVVADIGEDAILSCASPACGYAANVEKAVGTLPEAAIAGSCTAVSDTAEVERVRTQVAAEDVSVWKTLAALGVSSTNSGSAAAPFTAKVLRERESDDDNAAAHEPRYAVVFARHDREVNDLSLKSFFDDEELEIVSASALEALDFESLHSQKRLSIFVDDSLQQHDSSIWSGLLASAAKAFGANKLVQVEHGHFRVAQEGDGCPRCAHSTLQAKRGIEVGHVFYLGQKYSKPFNVTFTEADSADPRRSVKKVMEMGCYGMGVTRLIASAVEVSHDKHGIIWPVAIAPYKVIVMPIGSKNADEPLSQTAVSIATDLASGSIAGLASDDVILDDRWRESPGSKLAESELLGYPFRVVVGKRFAQEGLVEVQTRATLEKVFLAPSELERYFADKAAQGEL